MGGEKVVQELCSDYLIARPSVLYGWHPKPNFVTWVIKELRQGHRINIVRDQFNSPTLADNLMDLILELIGRRETGIYHTSGSERINRLKFAIKIADAFNLDRNLINPVTPDELNWVAKRPMDSSLDISKMSVIKKPLNIEESLKAMRKQE
ncbi:MAG: sugar nucleotide-binding protein [Candidatus Altiarchaeota archaeon]|nr:sugar nucleotide-binding protein [Candidatus Altiarchaeota archaeon]